MAIAVENVYNSLLTLIREDRRGLALSPDEFNRVANIVNDRLFEKKYKEYEATLEISDSLQPFIATGVINIVASTVNLPTDYRIMIGKPLVTANLFASGRYCDFVTNLELHERNEDYLTQPSAQYPVWTYMSTLAGVRRVYISPSTITGLFMCTYLRNPVTPVYDYYVNNTTAVITYMDVGANVIIPSGSTYRDGTAGDGVTSFPSTSVDWEWGAEYLQEILILFMELMGIALPDNFLVEVANVEETKLK